MSNCGGKTGRQLEQPSTWRRKVGAEDFSQAIAKISVTQVCKSEGFQAFQQSALEMLSDVGSRYILNIGKAAHQYANLAGRVECNVFDVIRGLEDMGSVQGFTGASNSDHCLESSGIVKEIVQFVNEGEPIPFAHPILRFPIMKERILSPSYIQRGEETPEDHIPAWLPAFPVPQAHSESPTGNGKRTETHADKLELERGNGKGERPLLMVSNLFEKSTLIDPADGKAKIVAVEGNPFLAAPLRIGDNEVASVAPPCKLFKVVALDNPVVENVVEDKSFSVLQTFGPAIEAMQSTCYDSKDDQTKVLLNKKPTVRFKIGMRNKFSGSSIGLTHQREEHQKTSPRFTMESEKVDRKMRAEKILGESLQNSDLLVQL